jgi:2-polyprenyl-3-methyl-5-hydroxy-6-metoxy-1,4-benzoquinol methylase
VKPPSAVVADFDRIAGALGARPHSDARTAAERFLLRRIPATTKRVLDVGCGDGWLSRALAARGIATLGIDASSGMIALARARAADAYGSLLEYRVGDIMTDMLEQAAYDLVVSVTMAHHVPLAALIPRLVAAVAPGGTLLVQDLTSRSGARHLPVNAVAWLARRLRLIPVAHGVSPAIAALYEAHGAGEEYLPASGVANVYRDILPGAQIHLHLEWRYTVIWRRPTAG